MTKALDVLLNGFADMVADRVVEKITVGVKQPMVEEETVQMIEDPKQEEKVTLEEIRTKCVGLTKTHRQDIKETLEKFGVSKLTDLKEADYASFFEEVSKMED